MRLVFLLLLVLGFASADAMSADVYTCKENGKTVFKDVPCEGVQREIAHEKIAPRTKSQLNEDERQRQKAKVKAYGDSMKESARKLSESIAKPIKGYTPHCPPGRVASGSGCVVANK